MEATTIPLLQVAGDVMFAGMRGHFVPAVGTIVEFTSRAAKRTLGSSSSGGGLFGRPMTRKSHGTLLNFGTICRTSSQRSFSNAQILVQKNPQKKSLFSRKI
jgi:hypothetical protein